MSRPLDWTYDDGGRADAGYRGTADDCIPRAIAIATGRPYQAVYDDLFDAGRALAASPSRSAAARAIRSRGATPRNGTLNAVWKPYINDVLGWPWTPTMQIGSGTTVHLRVGELPDVGTLLVRCSKHLVAVVDGVIHDTHDPTRGGTRAVYGYWTRPDRTETP